MMNITIGIRHMIVGSGEKIACVNIELGKTVWVKNYSSDLFKR